MSGGICSGRVAIVTGGGRGLGRAHALALASEGAAVVVNDLATALDGSSASGSPAAAVVDEITATGGQAAADSENVATWDGAQRLVEHALARFGRLDALVANAGTLLDRDIADMSRADWDRVVTTHLSGHAAILHHAARHWRDTAEQTGAPSGGSAVLTSSAAGLWGDAGRTNYSAAKAGIALLGRAAASELAAFGATVNVIAPFARSRMTVSLDPDLAAVPEDGFDPHAPANVSPLVAWLCSAGAATVTGQVFEVHAGQITVVEAPRRGPGRSVNRRWRPAELGPVIGQLLATG